MLRGLFRWRLLAGLVRDWRAGFRARSCSADDWRRGFAIYGIRRRRRVAFPGWLRRLFRFCQRCAGAAVFRLRAQVENLVAVFHGGGFHAFTGVGDDPAGSGGLGIGQAGRAARLQHDLAAAVDGGALVFFIDAAAYAGALLAFGLVLVCADRVACDGLRRVERACRQR